MATAILGITGAQGGSVAKNLLSKGVKNLRGLTRNTNSAQAKELSSKGVELIQGDYSDRAALAKLFHGAKVAFAVTNFWDPSTMMKEKELGKAIGDEAKKAGVQYIIWSGLCNVDKLSKGKYHVPHFTDKAIVTDYLKEIGLKVIDLQAACYFQNWFSFFSPKKQSDGTYTMTGSVEPSHPIASFDVSDTGVVVAAIFDELDKWVGKSIPVVGENIKGEDVASKISKATGKTVKWNYVPYEQFAKFGFPGAEEIAHMFGWFNEFGYYGPGADLELANKLTGGKLKSFDQFLESNKGNFKFE